MSDNGVKVESKILTRDEVTALARNSQIPDHVPSGIAIMIQVRKMLPQSIGKVTVLPTIQILEAGPAETRDAMMTCAAKLVDETIEHLRQNNFWPRGRK